MAAFAQSFFQVPLVDLGITDVRFAGILCPEPEVGAEKLGISDQFLADAETYHARYAATEHWTGLFRQALDAVGFVPRPGFTVLDIGAGSGINSVYPLLRTFEDCRIIATDLSPNLLAILRQGVLADGLQDRVACVAADAMKDFFRPGAFDFVLGGSILHHLLDPRQALAAAARALRPGGTAVFFEPFEGASILRIAYDLVLERADREGLPLDPAPRRVLQAMSLDYATRMGADKSAEHFRHMDDKWLFTRHWLAEAVRDSGFEPPCLVPHRWHERMFHDATAVNLRLAAGLAEDSLPDWAWTMVDRFDAAFSPEMKRDLMVEGTIVLRRPALPAAA